MSWAVNSREYRVKGGHLREGRAPVSAKCVWGGERGTTQAAAGSWALGWKLGSSHAICCGLEPSGGPRRGVALEGSSPGAGSPSSQMCHPPTTPSPDHSRQRYRPLRGRYSRRVQSLACVTETHSGQPIFSLRHFFPPSYPPPFLRRSIQRKQNVPGCSFPKDTFRHGKPSLATSLVLSRSARW